MVRVAVLDKKKCKSKICGFLCIKACPRVRAGDETITPDAEGKFPVISEELCIGCGICVGKCPFGAITIVNLPEETGTLTHQYGKNGFRLYGLPIPRDKTVVGIIGVNGIGKSTALKILGGQLKPNLGRFEEEPEWSEIVREYRGNEVQNYLEKLRAGGVKLVSKPQYVSAIPQLKKGTARELLQQVKDGIAPKSPEWLKLVEELELESFLDKEVETLSGGELQRLAIATALMRNVDVYFFDEPSSYLDIRQRLKAAKAIRELIEAGKSVVVVEHDLIVLDYLSDYIQVAYGHKGAFGIFSQLKSTRVGINEYLSGFLRSENVRMRPDAIRFEDAKGEGLKGNEIVCRYPRIRKKFPDFALEADGGELYNEIVTGVLGPNATGKTTMMRILAGEEENDSEEKVLESLRISYKPQYLRVVDKTVREVLQAVTKDLYKSHYQREILQPLELENLLDSNLESLSGGEMQRVAIAECISRDADLYLLDEPSAYLDVEQRLVASKVIRRFIESNKKSAVVIDHDIAFIDYVADRVIVFSGEPGKRGYGSKPMDLREGMNEFLKGLGMTFRRDQETKRPRANKPGSQMDREQKAKGEYYYYGF